MSGAASRAVHLDLDGAWHDLPLELPRVDATAWGPRLRFTTSTRLIDQFYREIAGALPPFVLFGSGDFHHLTATFLRRIDDSVVLVSFDNHPDWDTRPPKWACGGWINRALELPQVQQVNVWGCGNFECWWPHQIFGNRSAERTGRLVVHPWADDRPERAQRRRGAIVRDNWREHFEKFVRQLDGLRVYVTVDLDCLTAERACTNWENGRFEFADLGWALETLRANATIVAGDMCGAYSVPAFARSTQRFASNFDHPELKLPSADVIAATNRNAFAVLWPSLAQ